MQAARAPIAFDGAARYSSNKEDRLSRENMQNNMTPGAIIASANRLEMESVQP